MIIRITVIRMTTVMRNIITASSALPMVPNATFEMYRIEERDEDDNHDDNDEGDDCDGNYHEDDPDDGSHDNCHRSIFCITKAADDCHDNYHRSILCLTNAAEAEIMMIIRITVIRMTTVMRNIITASSALPMVPNATFEMYRRKT